MKLSTTETVYLRWISQGKSLHDIAGIEKKQVSEIQQQLDNALVALNVTSVSAAVAKAKDLKLI
jgi:DNA-binding CsgD family transcriptional regulator